MSPQQTATIRYDEQQGVVVRYASGDGRGGLVRCYPAYDESLLRDLEGWTRYNHFPAHGQEPLKEEEQGDWTFVSDTVRDTE